MHCERPARSRAFTQQLSRTTSFTKFFVKILLFPDAYFVFVIVNFSVRFVFQRFFFFFQHVRLSPVVFTNKEISSSK